jgi:LacI family transcriptional regulator
MERAAPAAGYAVLIAATHRNRDPGMVVSLATRTDGMVVLSRTIPTEQVEQLARRVPVVLLAGVREPARLDHVTVANGQGSAAVTEHLVWAHGYQEVAFLGGPADSPDAAARFEGHRWALDAAGMAVPDRPAVTGDYTEASGARAVEALLAGRDRPPRELVCANDQMWWSSPPSWWSGRAAAVSDPGSLGSDQAGAQGVGDRVGAVAEL